MLFLSLSPRKEHILRGLLTAARCDTIKEEIIFMFEECEIHTWPIDCFLIAKRLYYVLRPYSSLPPRQRLEAFLYDEDGFSRVEENSDMCADIYGDWFCADAERRQDGDKRKEDANRD